MKKLLLLAFGVVGLLAFGTSAFADVSTDQEDYSPGSVVTIRGDGYLPGETVDIVVTAPYGSEIGSAQADDAGTFSWNFTLPANNSAVGNYLYTATGRNSGVEQSGTFTDAIQTETTVTSTGSPSTVGDSVTFTATVKSGNPATNTVTQGDVKFGTGNNCGGGFSQLQAATSVDSNGQVTYTTSLLPQGTTTIRACYLGFGSGSTALQASDGTFAQTVNAAPSLDTTPPVVNCTAPSTVPWYNTDVQVPCTATDAGSPPAVPASFTLVTSGEGAALSTNTQNVCDSAGTPNCAMAGPYSPYMVDKTNPTISGLASPAANGNGWNNTDVAVTFTCDDALSGIASCGPDSTLTAEGSGQSVSGSAVDNAGNSASATVSNINIDKTKPTSTASASPSPNAYGWNNTDVTISYFGSDALSGIDSCSADATMSSEGAGLTSPVGTCTDLAGNVSDPASVSGINIDKAAPTVSVTGVTDGDTYILGSVPAAGCNTSDALSGVAVAATLSLSGGPVVGSFTATCNGAASDYAGNVASSISATYTVIYDWDGFFRPIDNGLVFNKVKAGSAIPVKFRLNGNQGLGIFAVGYPKSYNIPCNATMPTDMLEETVTAGNSSLSYDPMADQYNYVWKTDKSYANSCRKLVVMLNDGTEHVAYFNFTK